MFVPGHNDKLMTSASKSAADILLLDIEDSVQPIVNKQVARDNIKKYISEGKFKNYKVFPRVNDRESGELLKDVYQLTITGIEGFMYPKSTKGDDVYFFGKLLETIEFEKGIPIGTFKIIPLIEMAGAVININEICQACPERVVAIAFGCEDYISDIGGVHDHQGQSLFLARSMIAMAAKANGIVPIDTVHINVHDLEDLKNNLILAKNLGFEGMLVLHPKELPLVHQYYSPSEKEISEAQEMLRLYEKAQMDNKGVAILSGKFIGPPMVISAKNILEKAKLL